MSKAAICVVVPVYKAMATLDRCVESVLAQQVEGGLTCILVDDGSPDESGTLCDVWAAKDDRVTVIHQDDLGVSGARNSGLAAADSEFIVFLDSDDALRPGALQAALTAQRAAPQDFVVWHYTTDAKDPAAVTADGLQCGDDGLDPVEASRVGERIVPKNGADLLQGAVADRFHQRLSVQLQLGKAHLDSLLCQCVDQDLFV